MLKVLNKSEVLEKLVTNKYASQNGYFAFYSSWFGGVVQDPSLMMVPLDDHLVHRGDGVFEAMKSVGRKVFLLDQHLDRLMISADKIGLMSRWSKSEVRDIVLETLRIADQSETLVRLYLSRGPGGFTTNPYECVGSQLYIAITAFKPMSAEKYENGVVIGRSQIPVKDSWMAQVKSCNYLPNVMMKKEAVDRGLDFTIGFDRLGFLTESSTENIIILDKTGVLRQPHFDLILKGTTMARAFELMQKQGAKIEIGNISEQDILSAKEVMMIGTTLDVLPVTRYENALIADGKVGPIAREMKSLLQKDFINGIPY